MASALQGQLTSKKASAVLIKDVCLLLHPQTCFLIKISRKIFEGSFLYCTIASMQVAQHNAGTFVSCTDHIEMVGSGST